MTSQVIERGLIYAAEEMGLVLRNVAYSPNIKERMDHSCAIFDAQQRLVAQAEHIPVHLGSMTVGLRRTLAAFGEPLHDDDTLVVNDPYLAGTHLPDVTLIQPVFVNGRLLAYAMNKAHHADIGGPAPGSLSPTARSLYEEGYVIQPTLLVRRGHLNTHFLADLVQHVRMPQVTKGDLGGQIAANRVGARRVAALARRYGDRAVEEAMQDSLGRARAAVKRLLTKLPAGQYAGEDVLDDAGPGTAPARIRVSVTLDATRALVSYAGTDPQLDTPLNAVLGVTLSGVYYVFKCLLGPEVLPNQGFYDAIEVDVPDGCFLNPRPPAPVSGGNVETSQRNVDALLRALSRAIPARICAAGSGTMCNIALGGIDPESERAWAYYETNGGGYGGRLGCDGIDGIQCHMTNTMNTPMEEMERILPIRMVRYELRPDSGGPGRWRGGLGIIRAWRVTRGSVTLTVLADRARVGPWGLGGGGSGAPGCFQARYPDGRVDSLPSKCTVTLPPGTVFQLETPGGGGYGDPLRRPPSLVLQDWKAGRITAARARDSYGVIINARTASVDLAATRRLRAKVRAGRKG